MDASLATQGLIESVDQLIRNRDFEGAETLLYDALAEWPTKRHAEIHLELARVYRAWDKLTSAMDHVLRAAERGSTDEAITTRIQDQLRIIRHAQEAQRPG